MERLDGGYNRGFTRGLMFSRNLLQSILPDMKTHRRKLTPAELDKIFNLAIDQRELLRENPYAFIRCVDGGYDIFDSEKREILWPN